MRLMTYNEILTYICDEFDKLISPKEIARSNTNIIYLLFKAVSKGFELINNICVVLSHKFDPATCSVEDLNSVAEIVGTEKYKGSGTGLYISVFNSSDESKTLYAGEYFYKLDEETTFSFEVLEDAQFVTEETRTYIAMSLAIGRFPVTQQSSIEVTSDNAMDTAFMFSCTDNEKLLGTPAETDLEFRKRILSDTTRQDSLTELQTKIKNRPYIFDARVKFNNTYDSMEYDGITIPPAHLAVFYSGEPKNELAEIIAGNDIFPTVATSDSVEVHYHNEVFADDEYTVNLIPFKKTEYSIKINLKLDASFISSEDAENAIQQTLMSTMNTMVHKDYVKETEIYNIISNMNITGVDILNIDLLVDDSVVDYISVPLSRIPELVHISFVYEV